MKFEGLVVLALDLKFGLEFLDQELKSRDLDPQLLDFIGGGGSARGSGRCRRVSGYWRKSVRLNGLIGECIGNGALPGSFRNLGLNQSGQSRNGCRRRRYDARGG